MRTKILIFIVLLLLTIILSQCAIPKPFEGLGWNVDLNVPLMSKRYDIRDLADGENLIIENEEFKLIFEDELETEDPSHFLKIDPKSTTLLPIPPLEIGIEIPLNIDETGTSDKDIDITFAKIREGALLFEVTEVSAELKSLKIIFYDIFQENGEPVEFIISNFTDPIHHFPLENHTIGIEGMDSIFDNLKFNVIPVFESTELYLGMIRIFFDEPLWFHTLKGRLENQKLSLADDEIEFSINYPYNLSNVIQLHTAEITLNFTNQIGFDAVYTGSLTAYNDTDGKEYTLEITEADNVVINRASDIDSPSNTIITLDKPDIAKLINVFPERIYLHNSELSIGNLDDSNGFVSVVDRGVARFAISTPAIFKLTNEPIIPDTVYVIEIDEENEGFIDEFSKSAVLSFNVENTLPFGANISFYFNEVSDTLHIFNPEINPENNSIVLTNRYIYPAVAEDIPSVTEVDLALDSNDLSLFQKENVYFAFKVSFMADEELVALKPDQYIKLIGRIKLNTDIEF